MKNIIYRAVLEKGTETDTEIYVTQEVNGFGVFLSEHDLGMELLKWFPDYMRDKAIEWGVQEAIAQRIVGPMIREAREKFQNDLDEYNRDLEEVKK